MDYFWMPHIDICWDITKLPYPLENNSVEGIYTEHCLEHIALDDFRLNIQEFYRVLSPGGKVRIVVPDGGMYFNLYSAKYRGEHVEIPFESSYISPMARINGLFYKYGHKFIPDEHTLKILLENAGFQNVQRRSYMTGQDARLLVDTDWRAIESLYIEASKPK
jgi:predicted SAM-dependent methyltransferase